MKQEPNNPEVAIPAHIKEFTKRFIDKTITQSELDILDEWIIAGNAPKFIKEYKEQKELLQGAGVDYKSAAFPDGEPGET